MVAYLASLILAICTLCSLAWGAQPRQMCLSCHPAHYAERGVCTSCHNGNPASDRKNIAHHRLIAGKFAHFTLGDALFKDGERLMERYACRRCHVSAGRGNRLATSLDTLKDTKTPEEIAAAISSPVMGMPDFRLDEKQVVALVNAVLGGAKKRGGGRLELPLVVHFEVAKSGGKDVFSSKCGPCHRMLSQGKGVLGSSDSGPNLSGLLTEYYPKTFGEGQGWSEERLRRWLGNPRMVRKWARMPPVELSAKEFRELVDMLLVK